MAARVEILRKKAPAPKPPASLPPASLKDRLMAELERLLPADAIAFAVPCGHSSCFDKLSMRIWGGLPAILIIHRGRALGLEPGRAGGHLSDAQRAVFARLTRAGMRIEVARSFGEALAQLREMGLELETGESLTRQVAVLFRQSQSKHPTGGRP